MTTVASPVASGKSASSLTDPSLRIFAARTAFQVRPIPPDLSPRAVSALAADQSATTLRVLLAALEGLAESGTPIEAAELAAAAEYAVQLGLAASGGIPTARIEATL
jgi:hypothetical protein